MNNSKKKDYPEFDEMESGDWEDLMSGPDDDEIIDDECQDVCGDMPPEIADEMFKEYSAEMAELHDYENSFTQFYDRLCLELCVIIYKNGGNIGMKDAYIKLEDSSFWDNFEEEISKNHATVLGIELTERSYIDTKEAIWRENFVLTKEGVEYAKRLLQDEIQSFGSEKESQDDDKPF